MKLELLNIGKHYSYRWVFKNVSAKIQSGQSIAITGPNGIGKSTLLKIIAGYTEPSEGKVSYFEKSSSVSNENIYKHLSYAAPYIDLIEDYTLSELINFYSANKRVDISLINQVLKDFKLEKSLNKYIKHFSSGMLQRTKLLLSLCSENQLLLLDEPHTNLDKEGIEVFNEYLKIKKNNSVVVLSSNREEEIMLCDESLNLSILAV